MAIGNTAKLKIEIVVDSKTGKTTLKQVGEEAGKAGKKIETAGKKGDREFKKMDKSAKGLIGTMTSLKGVAGGIAGALAAREIIQAGVAFFNTGITVDRLSRSLETATGSYDSARKAQEFLRAESERLGLVYLDQIKGYRDISAASRAYNFSTRETEEIYLGVAEAATAMQMTQEDVNGVFRAFTQILSKGKLQAEEIRGQIGERLPGAFNIAAKAMGVTVAGLSKMLDLGQVMSEDFIPKFARQLRMEFAGGLDKAAQSAQANINRLKNTWVEMQIAVLSSGGMDAFQTALKGVNTELKHWLTENADLIEQKVPEYVDSITGSIKETYNTLSNLKALSDAIPGSAADMGIVGYALFRGGPGVALITAGLLTVNGLLADLDMNIGSLPGKYVAMTKNLKNIQDVMTGLRDASTGELIDQEPVLVANLKKELAGIQWMIDDWRDQNATPAGFIMSLFYGESPGEHWAREAERIKKQLAEIQTARDTLLSGQAAKGFGTYQFDFKTVISETIAGQQDIKIDFLKPYKFEVERVLEYGNDKWTEHFNQLNHLAEETLDFKKIYDVEAPRTTQERLLAIRGIVVGLEKEAELYGKTSAEIAIYNLENLNAEKGDIERVKAAGARIKKMSEMRTEAEKLASAEIDLDKFFGDIDRAESARVDSIESVIKALEREKATYGMTSKEIQLYELRQAEASGTTLQHAQEIIDAIALLEEKPDGTWLSGMESALDDYAKHALDTSGQVNAVITSGFQGMEDALVAFCMTGKMNFSDFARSIISDMIRIMIQQKVTGPLASIAGGLVSAGIGALFPGGGAGGAPSGAGVKQGWAHGGAFPSGISAHSNTITDRPTVFTFAKGAGIYGEAGPEAIMPLTRLPGGDLGVKAEGSTTSEPRPLEIHIHEAPGTQTRVEQSDDGNQLNVIVEQVEQAMTGRMSRGTGMAPFMDGRYSRAY